MNLSVKQLEELQQAYSELIEESGGSFMGCQVGFATHRDTGVFAMVVLWTEAEVKMKKIPTLFPGIEEEVEDWANAEHIDHEAFRTLKHSNEDDSSALFEAFLALSAGGDTLFVRPADFGGRETISVDELLDLAKRRRPA
jgi:hypothetical protein